MPSICGYCALLYITKRFDVHSFAAHLSVSHTRLKTKFQLMYDPKIWESYLKHRNSVRLVAEVVDDRTGKIEHVRRQSHQAHNLVTTNVTVTIQKFWNSARLVLEVVEIVLAKSVSARFLNMFKTSHERFWLWAHIGCTISLSWLYHQSWMIDCKISCFWSYNWTYPLTIGRAASRRTLLWLNMRLRMTWADWLYNLRRPVHDPTRSSVIVRSFTQPVVLLTATGRKTNRCMRSKFCISPNIHDRLYVLQIDRNRTTKNRMIWCDYCFTCTRLRLHYAVCRPLSWRVSVFMFLQNPT